MRRACQMCQTGTGGGGENAQPQQRNTARQATEE